MESRKFSELRHQIQNDLNEAKNKNMERVIKHLRKRVYTYRNKLEEINIEELKDDEKHKLLCVKEQLNELEIRVQIYEL